MLNGYCPFAAARFILYRRLSNYLVSCRYEQDGGGQGLHLQRVQAQRLQSGEWEPRHAICPPVDILLDADDTLPPLPAANQAGRPSKGPRKRKRVKLNGEFHSPSVHNAMTTAPFTSSNAGSGVASSGFGGEHHPQP